MKKLFALLFLFSVFAYGQDLKSVIPKYGPDAPLSYRVEFDGDPQFTGLSVSFSMQGSAAPPADQPGFTNSFGLGNFVKVKAGVYNVDGRIPKNLRSGDYLLQTVSTEILPAYKQYDAASMNIRIHVDNDTKFDFPPLKSVKPN